MSNSNQIEYLILPKVVSGSFGSWTQGDIITATPIKQLQVLQIQMIYDHQNAINRQWAEIDKFVLELFKSDKSVFNINHAHEDQIHYYSVIVDNKKGKFRRGDLNKYFDFEIMILNKYPGEYFDFEYIPTMDSAQGGLALKKGLVIPGG